MAIDPLTACLNAFESWATLETTRINAMTPAQRESYLQTQINVGNAIAQGFIDLNKRIMDIFHPTPVVPPPVAVKA